MSIYDFSPPPSDEDEEVALTPVLLGESKDDQSDVRFIKLLVSFTLGITLILAAGYLAAVVLSDGAILLRPSEVALQRHANYNTLVQPADEALTGAGVVACIVDSGLAPGHEDLEGINLVGWKDFVNGNNQPYDDHGHGTSMAGILVANGWLKGVSRDVDLLVAKALGSDGSGDDATVAEAIDWCVQNGAHVISLSLGGAPDVLPFTLGSGRSSGDAANDAIDAGVYVVAAAGNDGEDDDGDVAHPSSEAGVISVGGVTIKGTHWSGSSKGDNNGRLLPLPVLMPRGDPNKKPEIVAPAEGVPVLIENGGWGIADGTSAATVYVTGALCLLLEEKPSLKADQSDGGADNVNAVKQWLMNSAVPEEGQSTHDDYYGYGLLSIRGLITEATQA